ncbi:MAG: RNA polymerase subunit sigma-70 [Phycisphaerales bacterium]|nr:RNA polymerase subunit sigma-70 [Phycisphaerales bacterium]
MSIPEPGRPAHDPLNLDQLSTTIYQHIKAHGAVLMKHERRGHSLTPTALVNEAYARLAGSSQTQFNNRTHLLAAAALAMKRILIEHARAHSRQKRGGADGSRRRHADWEALVNAVAKGSDHEALLDLDETLELLAAEDPQRGPRYVRMVELRVFGGMTNPEIAEVLDVSVGTVEKDWKWVKVRLKAILAGS